MITDEELKRPTNKLRFIIRTERVRLKGTDYINRNIRVLQQWWEPLETTFNQAVPNCTAIGEWRDVPLEAEE
jgi:hypothetical protein